MTLQEMMFKCVAQDATRIVRLTEIELAVAAEIGHRRRHESEANNVPGVNDGGGNTTIESEVQGAEAECAAAKYLNVYWPMSVNDFTGPDIGTNIQIKSSDRTDAHLCLRLADKEKHLHEWAALVLCCRPMYFMAGYLRIADGLKDEWWNRLSGDRPPPKGGKSWWVPQSALMTDGWHLNLMG